MSLLATCWRRGWTPRPLWSMFERVKDVGHPHEEMLSVYRDHGVVRKESRTDNFNKTAENRNIYQLVHPGWLVVNRMKAWQGSLGISPLRGIVSGHYLCFRPRHDEDSKFVNYLLRSDVYAIELQRLSRGVRPNQLEIDNDLLRTVPLYLPDRDRQRRIAAFLDVETERIGQLIATKRRMISVVAERATAAIETSVLGLNLDGEPAVSEYYARRPRGWSLTLLRHLECEVQTGPFGSQLHQQDYVEGGVPVVNPANLRGGGIVAIDSMTVGVEKVRELSRHLLIPGDIVFGRRGEMGRAGLVTDQENGWLCGTGSLRLRIADDRLDSRFLKLVLETAAMKRYFSLNSVGSTMENLNSDIVLGMPVVVPPRHTQDDIVESAEATKRALDELLVTLSEQIDLLQERRRSLITAAVSGEVEVA